MSSRTEVISHKGRIVEVTPEFTAVEIISQSACSSCHAKGLCGVSESKTKLIQVPTRGWDNYTPGDEVEVQLSASMGHKAVWIAYVVPLIVMMAFLFGASAMGVGELGSGLAGIGATAVYYFVIWLLRGRLRNEYIFNIKQ